MHSLNMLHRLNAVAAAGSRPDALAVAYAEVQAKLAPALGPRTREAIAQIERPQQEPRK